MLADPRAESLSTRFASQWLRLQDVEKIHPDALLFPGFDNELAESYKRETELFFDSIVREDRNILDLLTADYTFVNERIARVYRMPNIVGENFRRVTRARRAPRHPRPGQRADADGGRRPHVAGAARQVDHGSAARIAAAAAAAERAAVRRHQGGDRERQAAVDARAHGRAPQEPGVPVVPPGDRSARAGARELRRRSARGGSRTTASPIDSNGVLYDGTKMSGPADLRAGAAEPLGSADPQLHRQPDVVRARAPHRVLTISRRFARSRRRPRRTATTSRRSSWESSTVRPSR